MIKENMQPYKGARDFYPQDKRAQQWMFSTWKRVAERYGYEEYDAPIIEPTSLYQMKGSDEIVNEQTYTFTDRGDRSITIRTEMTPSVSRMVAARRQELNYPVRWYSIPNLWRYERPQRGRLREFWQLNIDIFGVEGSDAEIEMIQMTNDLMKAFHATADMYEVRMSSRQLVDRFMIDVCGLDAEVAVRAIRLIDRKNKMEAESFANALHEVVRDINVRDLILEYLAAPTLKDLPQQLQGMDSVLKLHDIIESLSALGINNVVFDPTLVRGFDYYTDVVFEVFDKHPDNNRSTVSYTHLRAHETVLDIVCRLLLEKKK